MKPNTNNQAQHPDEPSLSSSGDHDGGEVFSSRLARSRGVRVHYAPTLATLQSQAFADAWATIERDVAAMPNCGFVGVDSEWFQKGPTAVLQIASISQCIVFHLSELRRACGSETAQQLPTVAAVVPPATTVAQHPHFSPISVLPTEVRRLLENEKVLKVGVNVSGDAKRLRREGVAAVSPILDLEHAAVLLAESKIGRTGLGPLSEDLLGLELGKEKSVTLSNWESPRLSPVQLAYAADDAIASVLICKHLMGLPFHRKELKRQLANVTVTCEEQADQEKEKVIEVVSKENISAVEWAEAVRHEGHKAHRDLQRSHFDKGGSAPSVDDGGGGDDRPSNESETRKRKVKHNNRTGRRAQYRDQQDAEDPYRAAKLLQQIENARASQTSVQVLSIEGTPIFYCDQRKARWYVEHKSLAVAVAAEELPQRPLTVSGTPAAAQSTEGSELLSASSHGGGPLPETDQAVVVADVKSPNTKIYKVIRLLFRPKQKSKLCMNWQIGPCEFGSSCPFAHGPDELAAARSRREAKNDENAEKGDDDEDEAAEEEEEEQGQGHSTKKTQQNNNVAVVVLSRPQRPVMCCICGDTGENKLSRHAIVPPSFRRQLPPPFDNGVADDFALLCLSCNSRVRIGYDQERRRVEDEALAAGAPRVDMSIVNRVGRYAVLLLDDAQRAALPPHRASELYSMILKHLPSCYTAIHNPLPEAFTAELTSAPDLMAALSEVSQIVPGEVHARQVIQALVGSDLKKAAQFIHRWRLFFRDAFCPIEGSVLFACDSPHHNQ